MHKNLLGELAEAGYYYNTQIDSPAESQSKRKLLLNVQMASVKKRR